MWPAPLRGELYLPKDTLQHGVRWIGPPMGPMLGPVHPIMGPRGPFLGPIVPQFRPIFPVRPILQYNSLKSYKLEKNPENAPSTSSKGKDNDGDRDKNRDGDSGKNKESKD